MFLATACPSEKPPPVPPKKPNNELIVGEFERRPPNGTQAIRFEAEGRFRIAKSKADLDRSPYLAEGTYKLEADQLTVIAEKGECSDDAKDGTYKVVLSKIGIRWVKVDDACANRARMDGQTWWRIK